jgi:hypothetical protein
MLEEMEQTAMDRARVEKIYRANLKEWYDARRREHFATVMKDEQTREEKAKIISYRRRMKERTKKEKQLAKERVNDALREGKIAAWIAAWAKKKETRAKEWERECRQVSRCCRCKESLVDDEAQALLAPRTFEQKALRAKLQKQIKQQVKKVLRRVDKQNIPMEIPEATEMATEDVLQDEMELEAKRVDEEMQAAARIEEEKEEKKEAAEKEKAIARYEREKHRAVLLIQGLYRCWEARQQLRRICYDRYRKHFDTSTGNYYYEDTRCVSECGIVRLHISSCFSTSKTQWEKPHSLGFYDLDVKDEWVVMRDDLGGNYYYNPHSMTMLWDQPKDTVICSVCNVQFAHYFACAAQRTFCEEHFHVWLAGCTTGAYTGRASSRY